MATKGNNYAAQKLGTTLKTPWSAWRTKSLPARAKRFMETYCVPSKGHTAGKPLKIARYQMDWLEQVFGGDVTSSVLTLGRGNGKSTFGGGLSTWALFDEEVAEHFGGQPQLPVCAPVLKQAVKGVYGSALAFVKNHPDLRSRALIYAGAGDQRIITPHNHDGELFPVAADEDHLQGLDPSMAFVDEVGFISVAAWDSLLLAAGKRPRNLTLGMGTRSPGNDPNALDHLIQMVSEHGHIDGFLMVDYSADKDCSIDDRAQWAKANPSLAEGYYSEREIERHRKLSPEAAFRTYHLNQKTDSQAGWLGADGPTLWHSLRDPGYQMIQGGSIWVGVDVSHHHDATAVVWGQQRPDARVHVKGRIWTPGLGNPIPFDEVEQCIRDLSMQYRVERVNFDPRYTASIAQKLENEGIPMEEVPQSHARMVPMIGETYRHIVAKTLTHDADATFTSHVLNAIPYFGDTTGFSLSKNKSKQHIDACIAMCMAVGSLELCEPALPDSAFKIHW